ncbi:MAG: HAMP domain-containing histidine kinase [candidate division Zixibacteria bacterium]|nr:HAMP domain-containing histidine kinase [candidate division Zixibacteria bacterium]
MTENATHLQHALSLSGVESELVLPALDTLSANQIAYHSVSTLAVRMQVTSEHAARLLKPLESTLLEAIDRTGERWYCFAPTNRELQEQADILLESYRSERERLREILGRQAEIARLRDELDLSHDLMHTILQNVGEILIVDLQGMVLAASVFVQERLGIRQGDLHPTIRERLGFDPLDQTVEKTDVPVDGRFLECHLSDFVSRGKRIGRNISIKDVTEERKLQEAREMYERSRKQLFSIIAHELQNPALGLQSFLQDTLDLLDRLLVSGKAPELEQDILSLKEDVYLNQRGQTLLNRVIGDIFDYVKLQRGQMQFTIESDVSVDYLIALCSMQCKPLCARKGIRLVVPPDDAYETLPDLSADSTRMAQVLNNLIKNSVKFTPAHGEIRLEVDTVETPSPQTGELRLFACIAISDTGRGMTREEMDMIFKEYRGSESDGMGLGLMIADLIVRAHGGHIDIESVPGHGSTFRILLPIATSGDRASGVLQPAFDGSFPRRNGETESSGEPSLRA